MIGGINLDIDEEMSVEMAKEVQNGAKIYETAEENSIGFTKTNWRRFI
jgi:hypothetical protein